MASIPILIGSQRKASRSPRITASTCSRSKRRPGPRYGVKGAAVHLIGPRRLHQHVPARHPAGRFDVAAAPPLRGRLLCARRHGLDAGRVRRWHEAQLRMGPQEPVRDPAERQAPPLQRLGPRARAACHHDRPAAGPEHVPQREVRVRERFRLHRARRQAGLVFGRGRSHHRSSRQPHVGDELRSRSRRHRAEGVGRSRRGRHQHHVRPRRRHDARAHLRNAGRHLQEGPSPRPRLPRDVRHRPRLFAALVRRRQGLPPPRLEARRRVPAGRQAVPPALQHEPKSRPLPRHRHRRPALSAYLRRSAARCSASSRARRARCRRRSRKAATSTSTRIRIPRSMRSGWRK